MSKSSHGNADFPLCGLVAVRRPRAGSHAAPALRVRRPLILACAFFLTVCCFAAAAETETTSVFWAEIEGQVRIERGQNGATVRIFPSAGIPLRVESGIAVDGSYWDGRWAEVKGTVSYNGTEAVLQVREFSLEDDTPNRFKPSLETEGFILNENSEPILRTRDGDVPLVGYPGLIPHGALVEIKGSLALDANRLVVQVARVELD